MTPEDLTAAERAITRIVYDYGNAVDTGDFDTFGEIFRYGAVRVHGVEEEWHGSEAVAGMLRRHTRVFDDGTPSTKHVTTNLVIDVDPDGQRATSRSYFTVLQARPELPLQPVIAGRYYDNWELRDGRWWLTDRYEYCDLIGDMSQHIRDNPLPG